ncbi:hypothetical protein B0H15DRAFT_490989 [Mycena belliarum]|uniref:Uncharacterized protein n=1 Tax=Mycena belliarum TaxID=1033014 RepID=A0AAD6TWM3_9AGAR|nr:hypothetical protein B0H15DRAFT_490989 [Mycena belliae]
MVAFIDTTNFDLHTGRGNVSYNDMAAGPSCQSPPRSPQYDDDLGQRGSYDEGDEQESEKTQAKQRECARRVAAWINQSAVRITAVRAQSCVVPRRSCADFCPQIASPYGASPASFDLLDLDLDLEDEHDEQDILGHTDFQCIPQGEPYLLYSSSCKSVGAPRPVIHAPAPRRPSRSRSRRHHSRTRPRMPSPLYVIKEEDSE